ncbi:MAG: choice-of-anchor Q domain-containing protein [Chloroflexota bacterium]
MAVAAFAIAAALAVLPGFASAATYTVNTTADQAPSVGECGGAAGDCSLRQAVDKANSVAGADTIVVPAGRYALTIKGGGETENGDLDVTEGGLRIEGAGARSTVVDAAGLEDRAFDAQPSASLTLAGLTVTGGRTEEGGGGIRGREASLALEGVAVTGNEGFNASSGGGVYAVKGELRVVGSTISGNRDSGDGGGIAGNHASLSLENSTLANNVVDTSLYPGDPSWGAFGGAMEADHGGLVMKNVTISGNSIADNNGGPEEQGEGAALADYGPFSPVEIVNTIVYGNTASKVQRFGECSETLTSAGHNLEGGPPSGEPRCFENATDLIANPLLGALADNGGETETMALTAGSPAIDGGDAARCPATDQRGVSRPQAGGCDIGAFELVPEPPAARFSIKKVRYLRSKGTAKLKLRFTGPGRLKLTGKGVRKVSRRVRAGVVFVPVKPKRALRAVLRSRGWAKVKVKIRFVPDTGAPETKIRKLRLRLAT